MKKIERVGVLGGGLMGSGIAQVSAAAGFPTVVREISDELGAKSRQSSKKPSPKESSAAKSLPRSARKLSPTSDSLRI